MRGRLPWIALAAGAYVAFVVSLFPAATAVRWFVPTELAVAGVNGTVWSGSAALASIPGLALRDVRWNLRRLPLMIGRAAGELSARLPSGFLETGFSASFRALELSDLRLSTDIDSLAGLLPVSGASGLVSATIDRLVVVDNWPSELRGQIRVSDLLVEPLIGAEQGPLPLGNHEVLFQGADAGTLRGVLHDLGGPLEVNGTLTLSPEHDYVLEGKLLARPGAAAMLVQSIGFMTSDPDESGRRTFTLTGSL
jgi:general secretion pathway protein N